MVGWDAVGFGKPRSLGPKATRIPGAKQILCGATALVTGGSPGQHPRVLLARPGTRLQQRHRPGCCSRVPSPNTKSLRSSRDPEARGAWTCT